MDDLLFIALLSLVLLLFVLGGLWADKHFPPSNRRPPMARRIR